MAKEPKYKMTISLNVLNHLGINLYSNVPAVLSEVVANSWDADAHNVDITIQDGKIIITDDGYGMTVKDMNDKYLNVGYEKRVMEGDKTNEGRPLMGRKGIGKLSLFSIADIIRVESLKDGEKNGLEMSAKKIKEEISKVNQDYKPDPLDNGDLTINDEIGVVKIIEHGTRITITDIKKGMWQTSAALRKRIARRFSIIGSDYKFVVNIDGKPVEITDRDYFHKIQYLWYFGEEGKKYKEYCKADKLEYEEKKGNTLNIELEEGDEHYNVLGWIGSVTNSGQLKDEYDNLNKIVVMVRGKLAQEDILKDFTEGGLFSKYLIGEIHADFIDITGKEDIATSSRQEVKKDDERYIALRDFVYGELKHIQNTWTDLRKGKGTEEAQSIPAIADWFNSLKGDDKAHARSLFGKIGQLKVDKDEERRELYKQSVLAFENMKYKRKLEALEQVSPDNIAEFTGLIADFDDLEATKYHQIIKERLKIIEKLKIQVDENALEKVVQQHLYDHLWLLDPSWDRATETPYMEQQVKTAFDGIDAGLSEEEKRGRVDIRYKNSSGKHIIIELKRAKPSPIPSTGILIEQIDKYREALRKILRAINKDREPIEVVCLIGCSLKDWTDETGREESIRTLAGKSIRVLLYQEMINNAYRAYNAFIEKNREAGKLAELIDRIELEEYE